MELYTGCSKCGAKIGETQEERRGYPKAAITLLKADGRVENVDLCWKCRQDFVWWLKGGNGNEPAVS